MYPKTSLLGLACRCMLLDNQAAHMRSALWATTLSHSHMHLHVPGLRRFLAFFAR